MYRYKLKEEAIQWRIERATDSTDGTTARAGTLGALTLLKSGAALAQTDQPADPGVVSSTNDDSKWKDVEDAFGGTKGMVQDDGVFLIELSRTDIQPTLFGISVKPDFALDGEVAFYRTGDNAVMKFEVVLLDSEVNPFLDAWFDQNQSPSTEVFTAVHNHYLEDSPRFKFLHGFAQGGPVHLARALYTALSHSTKTPFGHGDEPPGNPVFDTKKVADIIGGDGQLMNGVLSVSVPRKEHFRERGVVLPPSMLFESMFNFQSIGNGQVATVAEFTVLPNEADAVSRELRKHDLLVTALHSHELDVHPVVYYVHCLGEGFTTRPCTWNPRGP